MSVATRSCPKGRPTSLTDEQVRTQFVLMSVDLMRLLLAPRLVEAFIKDRVLYEEHGGRLDAVRWVDGTIMFWAHRRTFDPGDLDHLVHLYRLAHAAHLANKVRREK